MRAPGLHESVRVRKEGEPPELGAVTFSQEEWHWCLRLVNSMREKEEREGFWAGVVEQKNRNFSWSVFAAFPKTDEAAILRERRNLLAPMDEAQRKIALSYSRNILAMLREKRKKNHEPGQRQAG